MLSMMRVDGSLGSWSHKNIHLSPRHCNDDDKGFERKVLKCLRERKVTNIGLLILDTLHQVFFGGRESSGHRSLENSHSNSSHIGGSEHRSSLTSHSSSRNCIVYGDRDGSI